MRNAVASRFGFCTLLCATRRARQHFMFVAQIPSTTLGNNIQMPRGASIWA